MRTNHSPQRSGVFLKNILLAILTLGTFSPTLASAKIKLVTTTTTLAWAATVIGGENVEVVPLLRGSEDVHFVDAVPSFIRKVAEADILCANGLDLEIGWLPKILTKSGNAKVQPGGKGFCEVGRGIQAIDVPKGNVDRSMGDVHAAGNPHFCIAPNYLAKGAEVIADALMEADPGNAAKYRAGLETLKKQLSEIQKRTAEKLRANKKLQAGKVLEYHKEFSYFLKDYALNSFGSLEETPGVPPSAGRVAEISTSAKNAGVVMAIAAPWSPRKVLEKFTEFSGIPFRQAPLYVDDTKPEAYAKLQEKIADAILEPLK